MFVSVHSTVFVQDYNHLWLWQERGADESIPNKNIKIFNGHEGKGGGGGVGARKKHLKLPYFFWVYFPNLLLWEATI